jgi:hypothetical protein
MRRSLKHLPHLAMLILLSLAGSRSQAQEPAKKDLLVNVGFYDIDNRGMYLSVHARTKIDGRFQPVKAARVRLYLDKDSAACLTGDLVTDPGGEGRAFISPGLKDQWNASPTHTFIAVTDGDTAFNASRTESSVTRARLTIDTGEGHTLSATMQTWKNGAWTPAKGVDIKVDIKRSGGNLAAADKELYTTDSSGKVAADFKREGLPGDDKGLLTLIAKVEDNDQFGNLQTELSVPWGSLEKPGFSIFNRTLWGTRSRTPLWLLFMAYSIFFSVWSVLVYLFIQVRKIKKAGRGDGYQARL